MIDFKTLNIDPGVLKLMSKRAALELTVLPIAQKNDVVIVAVPEMFRRRLLTDVRFLLGKKKKIKPVSASHDSIIAAIHHFYGTSEK
jgi:hypothetical protein